MEGNITNHRAVGIMQWEWYQRAHLETQGYTMDRNYIQWRRQAYFRVAEGSVNIRKHP